MEFRLNRDMHRRLGVSRGEALNHRNIMLFRFPAESGLDALAAFDVVLMVSGTDGGGAPLVVEVPMTYQLPERTCCCRRLYPCPCGWKPGWKSGSISPSLGCC